MAKTKISELEKQLGRDRKEIIAFLNEQGIEAKTASSSVDDDAVALVSRHFASGRAVSAPKKPEAAAEQAAKSDTHSGGKIVKEDTPKTENTERNNAEKAKPAGEAKPVTKTVQRVVITGGQGRPQVIQRPAGDAPKKKKVIIVTANGQSAGNNYTGGQPRTSQGGRNAQPAQRSAGPNRGTQDRGGRGGTFSVAPAHRIIKPKTAPTQMEVDYHKPEPQPRVRPAAAPVPEVKEAAAAPGEVKEEILETAAPEVKESVKPEAEAAVSAPAAEVSAAEKPAPEAAAEKAEEKPAETAAPAKEEAPAQAEAPAVKAEPAEAAAPVKEAKGTAGEAPARREAPAAKDGGARDGANKPAQGQARGGQARPVRKVTPISPEEIARRAANAAARNGNAGRPNIIRNDNNNRGARQGGYSSDRTGGRGGFGTQGGRPGQGTAPRTGFQGQGGQRTGGGAASQGAPGFRGGQNAGGPGRRPAGAGRPGAAPAAPAFGQGNDAKGRGGNRRGQNAGRDRRNGRDSMYTDGVQNNKNRAGRFIRPEKKEEVVEEQIKTITVPEKIILRDLADKMHLRPADIIKKLFLQGQILTPNSELSYEEAEKIAVDYDILCEKEEAVDVIEELLREDEEDEENMVSRPPVICVMGHVDHGKTSLLDAIRKTHVTAREAGGITQAIGAYTVSIDGRSITFLDTPGHEAFTAMRMRGANSTDIAVLVVAADDGVMPQTIEAINHAKAAGIEIIVAVNKIDKPEANVERVKQELTEYDLVSTDWGGQTEFVPVSAKTGEGLDDLLETILLTADILELKANPDRSARGLVLEALLDKGRGPVANVLIQKGTLHVGDFISAGASSGKVRAMIDDKGRRVKEAGPSTPVEILGLSDVPSAGEVLVAHEDDKTAKAYAETYRNQHKESLLEETRMRMSLDDLFSQMKEGNLKEFDIIIKADVQGSVEALKQSLAKLSNDEVVVKCIHSGVGAISESDVSLASASNEVIIGFNVRPDPMAKAIAEREGVDVRLYSVIYEAIDAVEAAMKGMLAPVYEEKIIGHAEIRQIFRASQIGNIGGSSVTDGIIQRGCKVRITRDGEQIFEGGLKSLKRFKDDVREVREGFECGLVFDGFDQINIGDRVEAYVMVEKPRE